MSKISQPTNLDRLSSWEELRRWTSNFAKNVFDTVNGRLEFDLNMRGQFLNLNFEVAAQDTEFRHTLGYAPKGYIVTRRNTNMNIYDAVTDTTTFRSDVVTLRSSAVGYCTIFLF